MGELHIVDHDVVELSNLQRQVLHTESALGRSKTASAREQLVDRNPDIVVTTARTRVHRDNAADVVAGADVVVDGCDNFATRAALNNACIQARIPMASAALAGFVGQVTVFAPGGPCYRCLYPVAADESSVNRCDTIGVFGPLAGVLGCWQAAETIKYLLGLGTSLAGQVLLIDLLHNHTRTFALARDPACPACARR